MTLVGKALLVVEVERGQDSPRARTANLWKSARLVLAFFHLLEPVTGGAAGCFPPPP